MEIQDVAVKIFNPYGNGTWYIMNQDPNDLNYLWAIVDWHEVEVGSVSLEDLIYSHCEKDLYFKPKNALEIYKALLKGEYF